MEDLSSSIPTIGLTAHLKAIQMLGAIVSKFLDTWEKIKKIRRIWAELSEMGITGPPVDRLTEEITTAVDEVVEESTEIVLLGYVGSEHRKHELSNALSQDTRRLFAQIERGLTIEFRAEPKPNAEEEEKKSLDAVSQFGRELQFPEVAKEPMLLESGQILRG